MATQNGVKLVDPTWLLREVGISDEAQVHLVQVTECFSVHGSWWMGLNGVFVFLGPMGVGPW